MDLDALVETARSLEEQLLAETARAHRLIVLEGRGPSVPRQAPPGDGAQATYNQRVHVARNIRQAAGKLRRFAWHLQGCAKLASRLADTMDRGAIQ